MKKLGFIIGILIFIIPSVYSQDTTKLNHEFSMNAQLRTRFEYRDGSFRPLSNGEDPAIPILNRIRLGINYQYQDRVKTKITLQNVNLWGQGNQIQSLDKSGNTFSLFEAWTDLKIVSDFHAMVGRQVISYDDERLFGEADWTNSGRSHDALTLYWKRKRYEIRTNLALNQNYKVFYNNNVNNPAGNLYNNNDAQGYKNMQNVWAKFNIDKHSYVSFLFSNIGFQNADSITARNKSYYLQTTGLNYFFHYPKLYGEVTAYYQMGQSLEDHYSNAYLAAFQIGYQFDERFKLGIGADIESGNTLGQSTSKDRHFQTLFATGHKFYGNMDYYNAGSPFAPTGLNDNFINFGYKINPQMNLSLTGHWFFSPTKIEVNQVKYKQDLGQEIDFKFDYQILPFVQLSIGYSTYFTTPTTGLLKYVANMKGYQQWAWISINVNPQLFDKKF